MNLKIKNTIYLFYDLFNVYQSAFSKTHKLCSIAYDNTYLYFIVCCMRTFIFLYETSEKPHKEQD